MNESEIYVNNRKYARRIFDKLMAVTPSIHGKTREDLLKEVQKAAEQGLLRVYYPEREGAC